MNSFSTLSWGCLAPTSIGPSLVLPLSLVLHYANFNTNMCELVTNELVDAPFYVPPTLAPFS